ncbi:peroxisomal catalase 1-like [Pararge aegeria]|uniref:peroxisomal catalase 1-like n=1 Tax=Pararge aegeria TaxID=116150 RepID=UPI0019D2FFB1|nr:peroxisomal catalase 1-like [Pararge aegeria]
MLAFLIILAANAAATNQDWHPAVDPALLRQIRQDSPAGLMSVSNGAPVTYCEVNSTLNKPLIRNSFLMDHVTSMDRERTCVRTVHGQGSGAFGFFKVTHDLSHICKASFLKEIGKKTPVAARFSSGIAEKGGSELSREIRGFALKFYTDEGIFDIPGIVTPMFVVKNPLYFVEFIHAIRKNPALYLADPMKLWDFVIKYPEAMHTFLLMFADRGIPLSFANMPCYNVHSLQVENEAGEVHFIRFHIEPFEGIKHLTTAEAQKINAADLDYYTRELYNRIKKGDYPRWNVSVQIVSEEDVQKHGGLMFDVTRVLPKCDFPLHLLGEIVLNRNPTNHFAEIEQLAFCPANLVNGILGAPDKVYEARRFAYADAQLYRLGPNVQKIPVNCPLHVPTEYSESPGEPVSYESTNKRGLLKIKEEEPYNYDQAAELYENELTGDERTRLHENLILAISPASEFVRERVIEILEMIHPDLAYQVAKGLTSTMAE